ncbi:MULTISPECIES: RNA polymerase sigma factor [unclassified Actinotalea]|uniref:RNA polymerase sigma factor n=1 Tax=unclassified Actinotalea TaxID=2638618 RepID=UPI0015F77DE9|nr:MULTISPECIES: DUF6596 domain-containing protein [unclassified Actinotalea]
MSRVDAREAAARAHREEWARLVGLLVRRFGDLDIAEDAAAEAFAAAVERWPVDGVPDRPGAWLTTTAMRKAVDRVRRESRREAKQLEASALHAADPPAPAGPSGPLGDDRLRLVLLCCDPVLSPAARVTLTLRLVGGLTVPEIARALLVQEDAVGRRITRAKAALRATAREYRPPSAAELPGRVADVLTVLLLVFDEGYLATASGPLRPELTAEAIRLARLLHDLLPDDGEVTGLLALMLLTDARRPARVSASGDLLALDEQDRGAWDTALLAEGHRLVRERLAAGVPPGRYQLLAAVNAVHTCARDVRDTDWSQVLALYDQLVRLDPSPVVALNRAVAVAELDGAQVALAQLEPLAAALAGYQPFHATRAELLARLGRTREADEAYDCAVALCPNAAQAAALGRRRAALADARSWPAH